ncbi:MAG: BTAD domain-containing putative transcriptional regulator, partial [Gemmatimonadota bacterium]
MIELRTLGTVDLTDASNGGDPGVVRSRPKALALLVYLALASRRGPVRRDRLLALLWPELPEPRARRALSQTLYAIRQDLGRDVIEGCGKDDLRVVPAALACDARDFQAALAADRMRDALRLYRGELLPGFHVSRCPDFDRWLEERRAELRRTAVRAALALAETEAVEGRHLAATRSVRWALAHAPHDEGVLLEGLSLLDRMGNRAGALDAYEEFVRRLRTELELEPAPETVARVEVMRKRHGEATPSRLTPPPLPERHAARDRTPARPPPAAPASRWPALATVLALGLFLTVWGLATTVRTDRRPAVPNGLSEVTMAVLPFRVSGPGMEIWREGMVDLLSANLDGTAGLRAVDARAVLAGVDRRSEDARAPRDRTALLETARSLGADYALV